MDWVRKKPPIKDTRQLRGDGRTDVLEHDEIWDVDLHVGKLLKEDQTKAQPLRRNRSIVFLALFGEYTPLSSPKDGLTKDAEPTWSHVLNGT